MCHVSGKGSTTRRDCFTISPPSMRNGRAPRAIRGGRSRGCAIAFSVDKPSVDPPEEVLPREVRADEVRFPDDQGKSAVDQAQSGAIRAFQAENRLPAKPAFAADAIPSEKEILRRRYPLGDQPGRNRVRERPTLASSFVGPLAVGPLVRPSASRARCWGACLVGSSSSPKAAWRSGSRRGTAPGRTRRRAPRRCAPRRSRARCNGWSRPLPGPPPRRRPPGGPGSCRDTAPGRTRRSGAPRRSRLDVVDGRGLFRVLRPAEGGDQVRVRGDVLEGVELVDRAPLGEAGSM